MRLGVLLLVVVVVLVLARVDDLVKQGRLLLASYEVEAISTNAIRASRQSHW